MKKLFLVLNLLGLLFTGACASMRDFIMDQAETEDTAVDSDSEETGTEAAEVAQEGSKSNGPRIEIRREYYYQALARWPWAEGSQLHRRALILAAEPSYDVIDQLDQSREPETEIRIMTEIARHSPGKFGLNARR